MLPSSQRRSLSERFANTGDLLLMTCVVMTFVGRPGETANIVICEGEYCNMSRKYLPPA